VFVTVLCILLVGGPPRLRMRDPAASLRGDIDAVVLFQLTVWALAGLWVAYHLFWSHRLDHRRIQLPLAQKLGLLLVGLLAIGTFVSDAPAFTAFKVYQIAVMLLWTLLFVRRYGVGACLRTLLWAYAVYCAAGAVAALYAPGVMFRATSVDVSRLDGDLVVLGFGQMATCGMILLLSMPTGLSRPVYLLVIAFFACMIVLSVTRSAYLCLFAFAILAVLRRPASASARRTGYGLILSAILVISTGLLPRISPWVLRESETIDTLDGRIGLWQYLSHITLSKSPVLGLGYYAASREYGSKYEEWSGTAHSAFVEVFVGGGLASLSVMIALWVVLGLSAGSLLFRTNDALVFAVVSLLIAVLLASNVGEGIEAGPIGFTFWCLVAILPALRVSSLRAKVHTHGSAPSPALGIGAH
jgi:hypothetical protein